MIGALCCCNKLFYGELGPAYLRPVGSDTAKYFADSGQALTDAGLVLGNNACLDFINNQYYTIRNDGHAILRADKLLGNVETVFTDNTIFMARALAVQPRSGLIFFGGRPTDVSDWHIFSVNFDGTGLADIVNLPAGYNFGNTACLVASQDNHLFYSILKTGFGQEMRRCDLDGFGESTLFTDNTFPASPIGNMRLISIDNHNQLLYFSNFTQIRSLPFAGGAPTLILDWDLNSPPLPSHVIAEGGSRYTIYTSGYSHLLDRLFFNLETANTGDPAIELNGLGLWSMKSDGSDVKPEIVFPKIVDSVTTLAAPAALGLARYIIGGGFETLGTGTDAH
jgi:hypothetical protein